MTTPTDPTPTLPHYGINLATLHRIARAAGVDVRIARRTGDVVYRHPAIATPARGNCRRKDAPYALVAFVRRVLALALLVVATVGMTGCDSPIETAVVERCKALGGIMVHRSAPEASPYTCARVIPMRVVPDTADALLGLPGGDLERARREEGR